VTLVFPRLQRVGLLAPVQRCTLLRYQAKGLGCLSNEPNTYIHLNKNLYNANTHTHNHAEARGARPQRPRELSVRDSHSKPS